MFNQNIKKVCKFPTKVISKKRILRPLKNGRLAFVDYEDMYKDIPASSYSLKSQLENGVHLQDCGSQVLEGVHGSDKLRSEVAQAQFNSQNNE